MSRIVEYTQKYSEMAQRNISEAADKLKEEAERLEKERVSLEGDIAGWKNEQKKLKEKSAFGPNVTLDVGGVKYRVSKMTLTQNIPRSYMLSAMFSGLHPPEKSENQTNEFFIDRNGRIFEHILEYLRSGFPSLVKFRLLTDPERSIKLYEIHEEAKFFEIPDLINDIRILAGCFSINQLKDTFLPPAPLQIIGTSVNSSFSGTPLFDYGPNKSQRLTISYYQYWTYQFSRIKTTYGMQISNICLCGQSYFRYCDLSGVKFQNCYFDSGTDFTGSVMCGVVFEKCGGLVANKIRFSAKQVREMADNVELIEALRKAGCLHEDHAEIVTL